MEIERKPDSPVFEKIKQTLDPAYNYVIFEKVINSNDEDAFPEIFDAISHLKLRNFEWKIHHDKVKGVALLVMKVDPDRPDKVLEKFLNIGIPKDITFYSYGSLKKFENV
jgi:hypothetical protein